MRELHWDRAAKLACQNPVSSKTLTAIYAFCTGIAILFGLCQFHGLPLSLVVLSTFCSFIATFLFGLACIRFMQWLRKPGNNICGC